MKEKFLSIVLNPIFISLLISLAIIYFLPDYFSKYKVELKEQAAVQRMDSHVYFQDLNNDNISEKIIAYKNTIGEAGFEIHKANGDFVEQWNLLSYSPVNNPNVLWFHDIDYNGFKEIYTITQKEDSIFLNIIEPFKKLGIVKKDIFIDTMLSYNNKYHLYPSEVLTAHFKSGSSKEVVFILNCGFGGNPRNAYKYNLDKDKVYKSPHLTNQSYIVKIIDINQDGYNEILTANYSAGNTIDSIYTQRSDFSSWFNVLDHDLNFLFNPIEFKVPFSSVKQIPFKTEGEFKILCLLNSQQTDISKDKLIIISDKGELLKEIELPAGAYRIMAHPSKDEFLLNNFENGILYKIGFDLEIKNSIDIGLNSNLNSLDLDADGKMEFIVNSNKNIIIYRENFNNQVSIEVPEGINQKFHYSLRQLSATHNDLYFQKGDTFYIYSYGENPLFILKYVVYLGIFLLISGLVFLIMKLQKIRMQKQRAIENEIAELQIKAIKNQVDPHFVFNAINTISEMTLMDNKLEADDFICRYSDFMRDTLQSSDKISTTLKEELEYSENFIKLQKIRYQNKFDYQIDIDKNIDLKTKVPKHVLFSYVENAIKHGLSNLNRQGLLQLKVSKKNNDLLLMIADNGHGLDISKPTKKDSTGNGLKIMENIYKLYAKLYKKKIKHQIIEVFDDQKNKAGIRVEVLISSK